MKSLINQFALPTIASNLQEKINLSNKPLWFTTSCKNSSIELEIELECGSKIGANRALLQFQFTEDEVDSSVLKISKSPHQEIGYYAYIKTQPGLQSQIISLTIPRGHSQVLIGIRSWCAEDQVNLIKLNDLNCNWSPRADEQTQILFSVDVEALPGRSPDKPIEKLIWGGHGPGGYGVGRLANIFNSNGIKATFYVDFATSCIHGDQSLADVANYLSSVGQDVQLHVHSEVLVRNQHWVHATDAIPTFAQHSFSTAKRAIDYAVNKYEKALNKRPQIFRAGGLWWCTDSILATVVAGIPYASNVSPTRPFCPSTNLFRWENGLVELPVDFCLDPYIQNGCRNLRSDIEKILQSKTDNFISCYLHSWSLSPRTKEGYHVEHSTLLQSNLEDAIEIIKSIGHVSTSNTEYLTKYKSEITTTIPLTWRNSVLNVKKRLSIKTDDTCECNICGVYLVKSKLSNDVCPSCKLRTRHRVLKSVLDGRLGNIFAKKRVLANHADPNEKQVFFSKVHSLVNFDVRPLEYLDCVADVQDLSQFDSDSFDVFYSIYVLNHVANDLKALIEMRRVLVDRGFAVIMVPLNISQKTRKHTDITQNYGSEALEKYGVGSYRYYGLRDFLSLLNPHFDVEYYFSLDPITEQQDIVFICRKKF